MPAGSLVIDETYPIDITSDDVSIMDAVVLVGGEGKDIMFRVVFANPQELISRPSVTIVYKYQLLKGPMATKSYLSQLRWQMGFVAPIGRVKVHFVFETGMFEDESITFNSGSNITTTYRNGFTTINFDKAPLEASTLYIAAFNGSNLKYGTCTYESVQNDSWSLVLYILIFMFTPGVLCLALGLLGAQWYRCRRRLMVADPETEEAIQASNRRKEEERRMRTQGVVYNNAYVQNHETNDGHTGVVSPPTLVDLPQPLTSNYSDQEQVVQYYNPNVQQIPVQSTTLEKPDV